MCHWRVSMYRVRDNDDSSMTMMTHPLCTCNAIPRCAMPYIAPRCTRSPTTTDIDVVYAEELTALSGLDMAAHAAAMFKAKADISDLSAQDVVLSDSKVFEIKGRRLRVSVHETTSAPAALERASDFKTACVEIKASEGLDEVLFFVVDILEGEATFVGASKEAGELVATAFGVSIGSDGTVVLPGVLSRKKQIMPKLERA